MVIVSREQELDPWPSLSDTHNTITASYPDRDSRWGMKDAPEYSVEAYVDADRRWLTHPVPFRAVPYGEQVQALQKTIIEDGRRFRVHDFTLPPAARLLEVGDVISWTSSRNGYSDKLFIIEKIVRLRGSLQRVVIKELDPTDYDPPEFVVPPVTGWLGRIDVPTQPMTGWSVEPATVTDANGVPRRPAIRISCAANLDDVVRVWVQVRVKETGGLVFDSDSNAYASPYAWLISGAWMLSDTEYEARGRYVPYSSRQTEWSEWLSVTTPDLRLSYADLAADILSALNVLQEWINDGLTDQIEANAQAILAEAQARIDAIEEQADALAAETAERVADALERADRFRAILSDIEALRDYVAEADFGHFEKIEELRTTLVARIGDVSASFDQRITVAVSDLAALAQRTTVLEAPPRSLRQRSPRWSLPVSAATRRWRRGWIFCLPARITSSIRPSCGGSTQPLRAGRRASASPSPTATCVLLMAAHRRHCLRRVLRFRPIPIGRCARGCARSAILSGSARSGGAPARKASMWPEASPSMNLSLIRTGLVSSPGRCRGTGTIDQIRIDLSANQAATDGFEIDWISIGSPSPGASRAELLAEQQARASGDQANAQSITALQALLQAANGEIDALASGVSALTSDVQTLENGLDAQAQALTSVQAALEETASADALASLQAQVSSLGVEGLVSQGEAITALRGEISDLTAEVADQGFAAFLQQNEVRNALTTASQSLTTRIEVSEGSLSLLAQAVTALQVALPGLASVDALQALTTRIDQAGVDSITLQGQSLTSIRSELADLTAEVADQGFAAFLQQKQCPGRGHNSHADIDDADRGDRQQLDAFGRGVDASAGDLA